MRSNCRTPICQRALEKQTMFLVLVLDATTIDCPIPDFNSKFHVNCTRTYVWYMFPTSTSAL